MLVNFDTIWEQIKTAVMIHAKKPDNIMIHPIHKERLQSESMILGVMYPINYKKTTIFGLTAIFTDAINEDEIICTYNA